MLLEQAVIYTWLCSKNPSIQACDTELDQILIGRRGFWRQVVPGGM